MSFQEIPTFRVRVRMKDLGPHLEFRVAGPDLEGFQRSLVATLTVEEYQVERHDPYHQQYVARSDIQSAALDTEEGERG